MRKLILALLALTTGVSAYDLLADRCWEVGGEALFWRACGPSYDYGVSVPSNLAVNTFSLKPDYDVGFRIWGSTYKHDCCHLFDVDWTHLRTFDSQRQVGPMVIVFPNDQSLQNGVVNADLKFAYDKVEIRAGRFIASHCNSIAWAYGGTGYLNLQRTQTAIGVDTTGGPSVKSVERASYEGGMLEVGVGADVEEPYCFHLLGHIGALIGIGERKLHQTLTFGETTTYNYPSETSCIAGVEMRLGVQWRYETRCAWIMFQVSYELDHWFDAFRLSTSQPGAIGQPPIANTTLKSVGFSGPSVSLAVRF
jgi:Legionella pneumophila major outer membrane protein precursor